MNSHIANKDLYESTLQLLRTRIRRKGDFPSLGNSIQRIQGAMRSSAATEGQLAEAILSDVSLTQKTLRLANSAMYASFGTKVSTVTQALHVLGTETVGHVATGLKLMGQLESAASTAAAKGELSRSVAAGMVSRRIAASVSQMDGEEASVATLLHRMGWLLVNFYLPEQAEAIRRRVEAGLTEEASEIPVLGAPAWVFGQELGKEWGLPESLCSTMNPKPEDGESHAGWIASVSAYAREFVEAKSQGRDTAGLAEQFAQRIGCEPELLAAAANEVAQSSAALDFVRVVAEASTETTVSAKPADADARLDDALRDLRTGVETLRVDQLVSMAAELVHRSMGFSRTLFFLRSAADKTLRVRIALGDAVAGDQALAFDEAFSPNVFHLALSNRRSVFIANAHDAGIRKRLPKWYLRSLEAVRSFLLVPVSVGTQPIGLLYADWGDNSRGCGVDSDNLDRLETIRGCMAQGFERLATSQAGARRTA